MLVDGFKERGLPQDALGDFIDIAGLKALSLSAASANDMMVMMVSQLVVHGTFSKIHPLKNPGRFKRRQRAIYGH